MSKLIVDMLQIPADVSDTLQSTVSAFIVGGSWSIPDAIVSKFPDLKVEIDQVHVPLFPSEDHLIWNGTDSSSLTFKQAYLHLNPLQSVNPSAKLMWNSSIPPSKSFLAWRIMHNKLPTDENLRNCGCTIVSICCLYGKMDESTHHLFFTCQFASYLWDWFSNITGCGIDLSSILSVLGLCNLNWSQQLRDVILAGVLNIIWTVWSCRNSLRFDSKTVNVKSAICMISSFISLSGNLTKGSMSNSIAEFSILKRFAITGHASKAPKIIQVNWLHPLFGWVKCNTDGAAHGSPGPAAGGGIFRDCSSTVMGCFASYFGIASSLRAELIAAMIVIETASSKGWNCLWLECDSLLVTKAFCSLELIPWKLRTRWRNCLLLTRSMNFYVSHTFREGNSCVDKLASFGIASKCFTWWDGIPVFVMEDFSRNRLGLPCHRFR